MISVPRTCQIKRSRPAYYSDTNGISERQQMTRNHDHNRAHDRSNRKLTGRKPVDEIIEHLAKLHDRIKPGKESVKTGNPDMTFNVRIAGDVALHYYTGHRMFNNVEIKWSRRILIPPEFQVFTIDDPNHEMRYSVIHMDGRISEHYASFPPDWEDRCMKITGFDNLAIFVMESNDLAVSKVSELDDREIDDISRLAGAGLIDPELFTSRMNEALGLYVGDTSKIERNAEKVLQVIRGMINDPKP